MKQKITNRSFHVLGLAAVIAMGIGSIIGSGGGSDGGTTTTPVTLDKIEVTQPTNDPLPVELKRQFTATGIYSDSTKKNITAEVSWSSSNQVVLAFSADVKGLATANSAGSASVTASLDDTTSAALQVATKDPTDPTDPGRVDISPTDLGEMPANLPIPLKASFIEVGGVVTDITNTATWSTGDASIGTVSEKGIFTGKSAGTVTIYAAEPKKNVIGQLQITVSGVTVDSVNAEHASTGNIPVLPVGLHYRIKYVATLATDEKVDLTGAMNFSSADATVISVLQPDDEPGVAYLSANKAGTARITATLPNTAVSFEQDVTAATATLDSLRVSPSRPAELPAGLTSQFQAVGGFAIQGVTDTQEFDVTSQVVFSSSDESKATISNAAGSYGLATGKAVGTTNISARVPNSLVSNSASLKVTEAILDSLSTNANTTLNIPLRAGAFQFQVIGVYTDNTTKDITNEMTYYISDKTIASFDYEDRPGLLLLNTTGATSFSVYIEKGSTTYTTGQIVNVGSETITGVAIEPPAGTSLSSVPVGSKVQLMATGTFSDASTHDITVSGCAWSTDDPTRGIFGSTPGELIIKTNASNGSFNVNCRDKDSVVHSVSVTVSGGGGAGTGLSTGVWNGTGICFNVSADRTKLTPLGSTCPEGGSLVLTSLPGTLEGTTTACEVNLLLKDDVSITLQKVFEYDFVSGDNGAENVTGDFTTTTSADGTAFIQTFIPAGKCNANWTAVP